MFNRYGVSYAIAEDPASYALPNIQPVHFFGSSREDIVQLRKQFLRQWIFASVELWILIFLIATLYLGAGHNPSRYTINLDVALVDFDRDIAGYYFLNAFRQTAPGNSTLHWRYKYPDDYSNNIDNTQHDVEDGQVWASVALRSDTTRLINQSLSALINTTTLLTSPFITTPPILVTYEQGRNSYTVNNYLVPAIESAIAIASARYGQFLRQELIGNLSSSSNSSVNRNLQLLNTFQLGSLLVNPLSAKYQNLHPASPNVGQIATTVGYIYLYLVSRLVVRGGVNFLSTNVEKVHFVDLLLYRVLNSIFQAFIISLIYSLIVLWFFGIHSGSLFMRYWMFNWLSVFILGKMVAIFTINFGSLADSFIKAFVALMLAAATIQISLELAPRFYRYGYGLPLYHIINGARHLLFNSHSRFALDVGVLLIYFGIFSIVAITTSTHATIKQQHKVAKINQQTKTDKKGYSLATIARH